MGRSADAEKFAATSAKASRCARAVATVCSGRASTSMSRPRARSASPTSSASGRPVRRRRFLTTRPSARRRSSPASDTRCPSAPRQAASGRSSSASTMLARSELSGAWSRASPAPGWRTIPDSSLPRDPGSNSPGSSKSSSGAVSRPGSWSTCASPGRPLARCCARAHAARPSRSAGPSRQNGPVSNRISRSPRDGSCTTQSRLTRSLTSGVRSRPPRPTTSTGRSRALSASTTSGNCDRFRHSTAALRPLRRPLGERQRAATQSAT